MSSGLSTSKSEQRVLLTVSSEVFGKVSALSLGAVLLPGVQVVSNWVPLRKSLLGGFTVGV